MASIGPIPQFSTYLQEDEFKRELERLTLENEGTIESDRRFFDRHRHRSIAFV